MQRPASNSQSPWSPDLLEDTLGDLPIDRAGAKALFWVFVGSCYPTQDTRLDARFVDQWKELLLSS